MQAIIYEDGAQRGFGPLALLRPVFDLRCGALVLREKLERRRPDWPVALLAREGPMRDVVDEEYPGRGVESIGDGQAVFLSARLVVDDATVESLETAGGDAVLVVDGRVVGAVVSRGAAEITRSLGSDPSALGKLRFPAVSLEARLVSFPWDLVALTPAEIAADARLMGSGAVEGSVHPGARLLEPSRVSVGEGAEIAPGAVLDARAGDVLIGRDATVMPNACVVGPASIGDGSVVKSGARIYGGTAVGPVCKIGGEVEGSIVHSYSNKQHDGFLGHSYVGGWVNLGAATDVSDLKNNYGNVRVEIDGEVIDTGRTFVGATIGDHTKTAIGTKLNTGTVIGIFSNVVAAGFPPKSIPSFSWGTPDGFVEHDIERAISTARKVMARRGRELSSARERLIRDVFGKTSRA